MNDKVTGKLGKYEILEEIGRGGFATVYRARDPHLDRNVTLKALHRLGKSCTQAKEFWR